MSECLRMCKICSIFAAQNRGFAVFSPRRGNMSFEGGRIQDILKRRLTRFVLVSWNLVNSHYPKHCSTRCPLVCNNVRAICAHLCIRRGLRCCCLGKKAIPEPQETEQQDCSPAFLFVCICLRDYLDIVPTRFSLVSVSPV